MTPFYVLFGLALLIVAVVFIARKWGAASAERDVYLESHDKAVKAREIDDAVARLPDDAINDELRGDR